MANETHTDCGCPHGIVCGEVAYRAAAESKRPRGGIELLVAAHARIAAAAEPDFADADRALQADIERYLDKASPGWRGTGVYRAR